MVYADYRKPDLFDRVKEAVYYGSEEQVSQALGQQLDHYNYLDLVICAGKFCGLSTVKLILSKVPDELLDRKFHAYTWQDLVQIRDHVDLNCNNRYKAITTFTAGNKTVLPAKDRVDVAEYLQESGIVKAPLVEYLLVYSILFLDLEMYHELKGRGVSLHEETLKWVSSGMDCDWRTALETMTEQEFCLIIPLLCKETDGAKLPFYSNFTPFEYSAGFRHLESLKLLFTHFNLQPIRKTDYVRDAVAAGDLEHVQLLAECGWFKNRKLRDIAIEHSAVCGKAELTAWLLEYKDRTADLKREQELDERRVARELAASPTSVFMQKKLWSFKELDDGSLRLTKYKGNDEIVTIPTSIGKKTVSSLACRLFWEMSNLQRVVIPGTVRAIDLHTFCSCSNLKEIVLPDTLQELGGLPFWTCPNMQILATASTVSDIRALRDQTGAKTLLVYLPGTLRHVTTEMFYGSADSETLLGEGIESLHINNSVPSGKSPLIYLPKTINEITIPDRPWDEYGFIFVAAADSEAYRLCKRLNLTVMEIPITE